VDISRIRVSPLLLLSAPQSAISSPRLHRDFTGPHNTISVENAPNERFDLNIFHIKKPSLVVLCSLGVGKSSCLKTCNVRLSQIPPTSIQRPTFSHVNCEYFFHERFLTHRCAWQRRLSFSSKDSLFFSSMIIAEACPNFFE